MLNKILDLTKQFVAIKSIASNKKALDEVLQLATKQLERFTIETFTSNDSKSLLIYNCKTRPQKFKIVLNGHLDVIPGKNTLYKATLKRNKLYGIGSMDMKASVACLILAFKEVANQVNYPLALQLVTDEQSGGIDGTKYQIEKGVKADFVIAGESTNFNIVHKAKGVLWLKISTTGKSSHSAYPWQGKNAIVEINTFLNLLQKRYPQPENEVWQTTVTISNIETTNKAFNKIPDDCTVWLDIRYIPGEKEKILDSLKSILPNNVSLSIAFEQSPLQVDKNNEYLKLLQTTTENLTNQNVSLYGAHGTSDVTYYAEVGCPGVEFGPAGQAGNTNDEYVDIPSLETYYQILVKFLLGVSKTI